MQDGTGQSLSTQGFIDSLENGAIFLGFVLWRKNQLIDSHPTPLRPAKTATIPSVGPPPNREEANYCLESVSGTGHTYLGSA